MLQCWWWAKVIVYWSRRQCFWVCIMNLDYVARALPLPCSCCRTGDLSQGPREGSCLPFRNELLEETHMLTKQETLLGKGARTYSSRVREPRRLLCRMVYTASKFMVMRLVSELSLARHSESGSFLVVHASLSQDGVQPEGFWEVGGHMDYRRLSPFGLFWILPVGGSLFIPHSLPGLPVWDNSCKWLLWCLARVGSFSQWFS